MGNKDIVKNHFEEEAQVYDEQITNLIPYYRQMVESIVSTLPFKSSDCIEIIDLGCGTGNVSRAILDVYPNAKLTCLDVAENMLQMTRFKLKDEPDTIYLHEDFYNFKFDKQYDAVVSSLALHHLETLDDKLNFFKEIYSGIKDRGIFIDADNVIASTDSYQQKYMEVWKKFMRWNVSEEDVENIWIPKYYEEDRPVSLLDNLDMLKKAGFTSVDVVWKFYNFATFMALK
jgi:tRNA (cmo5U34)-methyltransferase